MPTINSTDITFRANEGDRTWAYASDTEHVLSTIQRLLYMTPGTDIYQPDMGLDLVGRSRRAYREGDRDTEYESKVVEQLNKYTDIVVTSIACVFQNEVLTVSMGATYNSVEFRMQITSDPTKLENIITRGQ